MPRISPASSLFRGFEATAIFVVKNEALVLKHAAHGDALVKVWHAVVSCARLPSRGRTHTPSLLLKYVDSFLSDCCLLLLDLNGHMATGHQSDAGAAPRGTTQSPCRHRCPSDRQSAGHLGYEVELPFCGMGSKSRCQNTRGTIRIIKSTTIHRLAQIRWHVVVMAPGTTF